MALLLEALKLTAAGEIAKAQALRAQAFEEAPASSGKLNGTPFEWIADADTRLGPMLEAVVNARYYWIPLSHIADVKVEKPEDLRDLVWMPAQFTWINGGQAVGHNPDALSGFEAHSDPSVRLARRTEWRISVTTRTSDSASECSRPTDDYPPMEIRELSLGEGDGGTAPAVGNG